MVLLPVDVSNAVPLSFEIMTGCSLYDLYGLIIVIFSHMLSKSVSYASLYVVLQIEFLVFSFKLMKQHPLRVLFAVASGSLWSPWNEFVSLKTIKQITNSIITHKLDDTCVLYCYLYKVVHQRVHKVYNEVCTVSLSDRYCIFGVLLTCTVVVLTDVFTAEEFRIIGSTPLSR